MAQRGSSYRIETMPIKLFFDTKDGRKELLTDWRWLEVYQVNGVLIHAVHCRVNDAPVEAALAVERYERMTVESSGTYAGHHPGTIKGSLK
jgi:hypothetical protein